jgi:bifunctional non-homologous end joining protein LigD
MVTKRTLPPGFIVPAQPVEREKPPAGPDWIHEIKHDGYRMIVRRDGETVRVYSRRGNDWTARLPTIAAAARRIKSKTFILDGEAVVIGADGLSHFDELRRTEGARVAFLYAFDLLGYDGEDLREQPLLVRRKALARLLRHSQSGIVFNEHIVEEGSVVFAHACRLGAEGIVSKRIDAPYRSGPVSTWIKVRNPASVAVQRERSERWNK